MLWFTVCLILLFYAIYSFIFTLLHLFKLSLEMDSRTLASLKYVIQLLEMIVKKEHPTILEEQLRLQTPHLPEPNREPEREKPKKPLWKLDENGIDIANALSIVGLSAELRNGQVLVRKMGVDKGERCIKFTDDGVYIRYCCYTLGRTSKKGMWQKGRRWLRARNVIVNIGVEHFSDCPVDCKDGEQQQQGEDFAG